MERGVCKIKPDAKRDNLADWNGSLQVPVATYLVI